MNITRAIQGLTPNVGGQGWSEMTGNWTNEERKSQSKRSLDGWLTANYLRKNEQENE